MARRSWVCLALAILAVLSAGTSTAAARLRLHPCLVHATKARCGSLTVPENRALAGGRKLALRVAVLRGPGSPHRADPLFYLEGGPGGAATDAVGWFPSAIYWQRDLVLVDQRGTGGSRPLLCPALRGAPPAEAVGRLLACVARLGADPAQFGTITAMRDVDAVRAALGYRRINLLGISYGTIAAQIYLRLYPSRVRSVVLDSGLLLGNSDAQAPLFEQHALDLIAARCGADRTCANRFPRWHADLPALLDRLRTQPVETSVGGRPLRIDAVLAESIISGLARSADGASLIPILVSRAVAGDYAVLAKAADDFAVAAEVGPPPTVMTLAILCNEPWSPFADRATLAAAARGTYVEDLYADDLAGTAGLCAALPHFADPPESWLPAHTSTPVLALAGEADPALPPAAMSGLSAAMPNSRLVVIPAQGHVVSLFPCTSRLVAQFLDTPAPARLDTRCVRTITPPAWVTSRP